MATIAQNEYVDVIGCVKEISEIRNFISKNNGKEFQTRRVVLVDQTGAAVELTMWNDDAKKLTPENTVMGCVVVFPSCRVSDFGGKSLSASKFIKDIKCTEREVLEKWWKSGGDKQEVTKLTVKGSGRRSQQVPWYEAKQMNLGIPSNEEERMQSDQFRGHYFNVRGTVTAIVNNIEKPPYYLSCPKEANSLGKVEEQDGKWFCAKTGELYDSYLPRYILRYNISDWSDGQYVSTYNDLAEQLLGTPASEVEGYVRQGDSEAFHKVFDKGLWTTGDFTIRAKEQIYEQQSRIRYDVVAFREVNYVEQCTKMVNILKQISLK